MRAITTRSIVATLGGEPLFVSPSFNIPLRYKRTADGLESNVSGTYTDEDELNEIIESIDTIDYRELDTKQLEALLLLSDTFSTSSDINEALQRIELVKAPASNLIYETITNYGQQLGYDDTQISNYVHEMDTIQVDNILDYIDNNFRYSTAVKAAAIVYDFFIGLRETMQAGYAKEVFELGVWDNIDLSTSLSYAPLESITEDTSFATDIGKDYGTGMRRDATEEESKIQNAIAESELDVTVDEVYDILDKFKNSVPNIYKYVKEYSAYKGALILYSSVEERFLPYFDVLSNNENLVKIMLSGDATNVEYLEKAVHSLINTFDSNDLIISTLNIFNPETIEDVFNLSNVITYINDSVYNQTYDITKDLRGKDAESTQLYKYFNGYNYIIESSQNFVEWMIAVFSRFFLGELQRMTLDYSKATSLTSQGIPRAFTIPTEGDILDFPLKSIESAIMQAFNNGTVRNKSDLDNIKQSLSDYAETLLKTVRSQDTKEQATIDEEDTEEPINVNASKVTFVINERSVIDTIRYAPSNILKEALWQV